MGGPTVAWQASELFRTALPATTGRISLMPSKINVAVVGLGTSAQAVHLPMLLRRHDRFHVSAVVDISPRRLREASEKWGLEEERRYGSVKELMAAVRSKDIELDAVVFSADGVKGEDILQIIKRGIPVLVEPPVAYGTEELQAIAEFERMAGRPLVMLAYGALYDSSIKLLVGENQARDLRSLEFETLMPASSVMHGKHHVTSAAYDLPSEQRIARRESLKEAVEKGAGPGANQRDRDIYVKGLLTGVLAQLALLRSTYGPLEELHGVRHWPEQVIPGSIEVLGALDKGVHVRLVWHYLPFAPEYHDAVRFVTNRRQGRVELPAAADLDTRGSFTFTQKSDGAIVTSERLSEHSPAYGLHEAFYAFAAKGEQPAYGLTEALEDLEVARAVLGELALAEGRDINAEPEVEGEGEERESRGHGAEAREGSTVVVENPLTETPIVTPPEQEKGFDARPGSEENGDVHAAEGSREEPEGDKESERSEA